MSQSKVKSGSIIGAGDRVAPYDAMVYQDGTYTIAVDGDGNIIKKVLSSVNTDDIAIQAAIAAITERGCLILNTGEYVLENTICINNNIDMIGVGPVDFVWEYPVAAGYGVDISGSVGSTYLILLDVAANQREIEYTGDLTGVISQHDLILVYDDTIWSPGAPSPYDVWKTGEVHMVKSVEYAAPKTTITVYDSFINDYHTVDNASFIHYNPISVKFENINIAGNDQDRDIYGIRMKYCIDSLVTGCCFERIGGVGINIHNSYNTVVKDCQFIDMDSDTTHGEGGIGYGVLIENGSAYNKIDMCHFENVRNGVNLGGIGIIGQPRENSISTCSFTGIISNCVYISPCVESAQVFGCNIKANGVCCVLSGAKITSVYNNYADNADVFFEADGEFVSDMISFISCNTITNSNVGIQSKLSGVDYKGIIVSDNGFICCDSVCDITRSTESIKLSGNLFLSDAAATVSDIVSLENIGAGIVSNNCIRNAYARCLHISDSSHISVVNNNFIDGNRNNDSGIEYILIEDSTGLLLQANSFTETIHMLNSTKVITETGSGSNENVIISNYVKNLGSVPSFSTVGDKSTIDYNAIYT